MESWCELVSSYPNDPEPKNYAKALQIANTLLSSDLAPFEIEWLVQTLLHKPVDVFNTIASKRGNEDWLKNIGDSFKVISKIVCKYWSIVERYHDDIIKLCMLSFDAQTKKEAINCHINVLKNPGVAVNNGKHHINALESATTCKAPLALLVGNICKYCPEGVDQEYIRVWRIYLNMLQQRNVTDTVMNAILQGIDGLFENFGRELPMMELNDFYKDLSRKCAKLSKCIEPLLSILKSHAGLFKERLAEDKVLRIYLWGINSPNVKDALLAIYTVIFEELPQNKIKELINIEIQPRMESDTSTVKHAALCIAIYAKIHHRVPITNMYRPDVLEFQMRHRSISYQEADLVSICLASGESYVKSLLVTVIMYYDNIPVSKRQSIVVEGIFEASKDIRKVALSLLIELSRQDGGLQKYSDVWRAILDSDSKGADVLEDVLHHVVFLMRAFVDAAVKEPEQMLSLSSVLSFVLCVSRTDDSTQYKELLRPVIVEVANILCVCPTSLLSCKFVCVEMFKKDSVLKEILSSFDNNKENDTLSLMQLIFSKPTTVTKLLIRALSEMDSLLKSDDIGHRQISNIMKHILKLRSRKNVNTSDDRILQRDLAVFVGEHSRYLEKENFTDDLYYMEMSNKITVTIPNITNGKNYKIDLLRILQISLVWEDLETLYCLLTIISANLRDRLDPGLQTVVWRICRAIIRSGEECDVTAALRMCSTTACVQQAVQSIIDETNPEVRRRLCDSLQVMLLQDPGSEKSGELLTMVAEQLLDMIRCSDQPNYKAGLDITQAFINTLQENDEICLKFLPKIIILTSVNTVKEVYKSATDMFIEKIDNFDENNIKEMIDGVIKSAKLNENKIHLGFVLDFLKKIFEERGLDNNMLVDIILDGFDYAADGDVEMSNVGYGRQYANLLQILALSKQIFEFDDDVTNSVITMNDFGIINKMVAIVGTCTDVFVQQNVLKYLNEYARSLLDDMKEQTINCISILIENIPPSSVTILKHDLTVCLSTYKTILTQLPNEITHSFSLWCKNINIQAITEELTSVLTDLYFSSDLSEDISENIQALGMMIKVLEMPIIESEVWTKLLIDNDDKIRQNIVSILLSISEKCISKEDFGIILRDNQDFVVKYLSVYFERCLTDVVLDSSVFVQVVKYFADNYRSYEDKYENLVELLNKVWPNLESSTFELKLSVASDFLRLPRNVGLIPPVEWVMNVITGDDVTLDHKIRLITMLPGGEEYRSCYRHMAGMLPIRLSEMRGDHAAILRALLDSLATSGDLTLLEIIVTLAAADDSKGWWDEAMDACMASLADRRDETIYDAAYNGMKRRAGLGGCQRVFLPLLRHSTRAFCEEYSSKIISDVISTLKTGFKEPSNTEIYRERVLSYAKSFSILQVVIDKIPAKNLETGVINVRAGSQDPWHVIKEMCVCSVMLRNKVRCPDNASEAIQNACLRLQCSAYNCLVAALCKRSPSQKQYGAVFDVSAYSKIVDDVHYDFWPRGYRVDYKSRKQLDGVEGRGARSLATTSAFTGTVRTRIFMATLSENPLQYDMIPNEEDEEEEEEEENPVNNSNHPLNAHGCLVSITTLLVHVSSLEECGWIASLADQLGSINIVNAKWTIAQAICNAETELKPHAGVLVPALLDLVATTPKVAGDKKLLNNLHIDVLWTIIKWNLPELASYISISTCVEYLISTCIEHRSQSGVFQRLLNTLNTLLQMYGASMDVDWSGLQKHLDDLPTSSSYLMPILLRILKNKIQIPGLLPTILSTFDSKGWMATSKLPEVFGLALSLEKHQKTSLEKFWQILGNVKSLSVNSYVKTLMYAQRAERRCCNAQNFRIITDLASKVEKSKCLSIISMYLENLDEDSSCSEVFETIGVKELLEGDTMIEAMKVVQGGLKLMSSSMKADIMTVVANNCRSSSPSTRKQAYAVMLKIFQDLVQTKETSDHPAKRQATQSTPILDTMASHTVYHAAVMREVARGMFDSDEGTAKVMKDGVEECLSKDMGIRFAELFYIIFYLSKNDNSEMTEQGYVFLELLFRSLKQQDGFTDIKLSDEALPTADVSLNLSISQKYIETHRQIDVQMSIANILDVLIDSAKTNSKICHEICMRIIKCVQNQSANPRFDLDSVMAKILTDILKEELNSATPLVIETSRVFLDSVKNAEDFKNSLDVLKKNVVNTEGISYYDVLYEDFVLRDMGRNFFNINIKEERTTDIDMKDINQEFSIEGLKEVFGYLSNWDDLRIQDKRNIEELLPPLLTEKEDFRSNLEKYFEMNNNLDYKLWFNKMAGCFLSNKLGKSVCQFKDIWLNDIQKWPVREFVTSSVIEAVKWPEFGPKAVNIGPKDCLVEWAARLMMRSSYFEHDEQILINCRDDEFKWSLEANRRGLPNLVLECVKRNKSLLLETEALKWFEESLVARRLIALKSNDSGKLQKILETTEREDSGVSVCIKKMILCLKKDLGVLSKENLDDVLLVVDSIDKEVLVSMENKKILNSMYELAMEHYDGLWDSNGTPKDELLSNMASVIEKILENSLSNEHNFLICILLNRLAYFDGVLNEEIAKKILDLITLLLPNLDSFSIGHINSYEQVFPPDLWSRYNVDRSESLGQCKEYLQLICDPSYTLFQYCAELAKDLNNWKTIYDRIKQKYGSTYGGTDYRSLNTIKKKLFDIENSNIESRHKLLKPISTDLEKKLKAIKLAPGVDRVLRLSQLSPSLGKADILEGQRDNLRKLLGLPPTVYVVKFVEQVKVFMDSIRRPCEVTVLLSDGTSKRYLIKSGEPLSNDASIQRSISTMSRYIELQIPGYNVTTLSDDSAILEFLEDHDRLRDLMGDKVKIQLIRLENDKLVQSPTLAMEQHNALCNKIPVYTLRSSIEERCASMEEFIMKKQMFLDTLSTMTITNWLFGIGDRHLQNIMFNKKNGGICAIDWASIFQYGLREFVPARLTPNMLAVCNVKVLESRLQNMLVCLRRSQKLYEAFIRVSFYWKGRDFEEIAYIKDILEGNRVSYEITRDVIEKSNIKCKEEYMKTLDTVFEGFTHKQTYSVEDQVSCLLQHCTDPKILSIIPRGWESWI